MKHIRTIMALVLAIGLVACARSAKDERLAREVKSRISNEALSGRITVAADDEVVTLTGTVPDTLVKARAENIAKEVGGVRLVVNNLRTTSAADAPASPPEPLHAPPGALNVPVPGVVPPDLR